MLERTLLVGKNIKHSEIEEKVPFQIPISVLNYFQNTPDSKDRLLAGKFFKKYILTNQIDIDFVNTPENIDVLELFLNSNRTFKRNVAGILEELKKSELITEPIFEKKEKVKKDPEFIQAERAKSMSDKIINTIDNESLERYEKEANNKREKIVQNKIERERRRNLQEILIPKKINNQEYYSIFKKIYKEKEIEKDLQDLNEKKQLIKEGEEAEDKDERERSLGAKNMATTTERSIEYVISEMNWFGRNVNMIQSSEFDDILRKADNLLEIKQKEKRNFLGLATDVSARRLEGLDFEKKLNDLLKNIAEGKKTRIKYGIDSEGNPMREFIVPKVIIHFNINDVRNIMAIVEADINQRDSSISEEIEIEQKSRILNEIMYQCRVLSRFAKKYDNTIDVAYDHFINSVIELSYTNPEIDEILDDNFTNNFTQKLDDLINKFN